MMETAVRGGWLAHWQGYSEIKPEFKISAETRLDFRLSEGSKHHYIEVKNVTLKVDSSAQFPDAETTRGQKHLKELMELKKQGHGAEIVFFIQRNDVDSFKPAKEIDPVYADLLKQAHEAGVQITPIVCDVSEQSIAMTKTILPIQW
jgi:sugar fermentation stimulation protein A